MKHFKTSIILLAFCLLGSSCRELDTINTLKKVGNNRYLYEMEYLADYDLDDVIASDIDSNGKLVRYVMNRLGIKKMPVDTAMSEVNCTSFQAKNADGPGYLFGRNFDMFKNPTMVLVSRPKNGYASISVQNMQFMGYSLEKLPKGIFSKLMALAAIYVPMDGMNEKGLCTSIMALPKQPAYQDSGKHKVGTTILMRLFLDRCATVDEAIALLEGLDLCHDREVGGGYHYMVADASGKCAVIEFDPEDGWKTMVVRKEEGSQSMVVTNHLIHERYLSDTPDERYGNIHSRSWERYAKASAFLEERNGELSASQARDCLTLVHWEDLKWDNGTVEDTQYSAVYNQSELTLELRNWNDYGTTLRWKLEP